MADKPKKRRGRWLMMVVIVLLAVCLFGWMWLNFKIRSQLTQTLTDAGLKSPHVRSVMTGFGGFRASGIRFESDGVDVEFDSLEIHQPILQLIQDSSVKDEIVLSGGSVSIDSRQLKGDSNFSLGDVDLAQLETVANRVSVNDLVVKIFDDDAEIAINVAEMSLSNQAESIQLSGQVNVIEGGLNLAGSAIKDSGDIDVQFTGQRLHLVDQQWQNWPGIGPAVKRHLGADAVFDVSGSINGSLKDGLKYKAEIDTTDASLFIPKFQLPIAIRSADVLIQDGLVTYRKVHAAMGDKDVVNATGTTTIDGLPCVSKFQGDFTDVDVADLRKLVKEIPQKVVGSATGKTTGSVIVDPELVTTLRLSAAGDTNAATYGEIEASQGFVDVQIQPLVLTKKGVKLDLQGSVVVKATSQQQDVDDVLKTFDLLGLDRQFEFETLADGNVDLRIPLNSAADLRTWDLNINSKAASGVVGALKLKDLNIKTFLRDGQLVFDPAEAKLAARNDARVGVKVTWPLPNRAAESIAETGTVEVTCRNAPPKAAIAFFDRQMKNAKFDYQAKSQVDALLKSDLVGGLSFESLINLPSGIDRPVESWDVTAAVTDSNFKFADQSLDRLASKLSIRNGILSIDSLKGHIDNGGDVTLNASYDMASEAVKGVKLRATDFPATWLATAVIENDSTGKFADRTGLSAKNVAKNLRGAFDAEIDLDPKLPDNFIWKANSEQLMIYGNSFQAVNASGHYDGQLDIERIVTQLPGGGMARLEGDWIADMDEGRFGLKWKDAALVPLLKSQIALPESFESTSDGDLKITFADGAPQFSGEFDLTETKVLGGTFAEHRFEVTTREGRIYFRDIPTGRQESISFNGSFGMFRPFDFAIKGNTESLPLSTSVFDKLSGKATFDFRVVGQASPWKAKSIGKAEFRNLKFDKSRLSDIRSRWKFDTDKPAQQKLEFVGLSGKANLDSEKSSPESLSFRIEELQLSELASFRKLPVSLNGELTGVATIENWADFEKLKLNLSGESNLIRVGNAKLSNAVASASISNAGKDLEYSFESQVLDGKLSCTGKRKLEPESPTKLWNGPFPLTVRLTNGRLNRVAESISSVPPQWFKQVQGRVSASMDLSVRPGEYPEGSGQVSVEDIKYRNRLVSQNVESAVSISKGVLALKKLRADLRQGEVSGKATIPLTGNVSGGYEMDVRNFSLSRLLFVLVDDPVEADGFVNARMSGRVGRAITGSGTLGVTRAGLFGVSSESMKIPIRYRLDLAQQRARIEMPSSRVKAFRGTIDGSAKVEIGAQTRFESDLEFSNIDSRTFIRTLTGFSKPGTGKLNGTLELSAKNFRSEKDLTASFTGKLSQSNALTFPLLDQITRFIGNVAILRNEQFESDSIELVLSKGRIEVRKFRLRNALASIIVTGDAFLNGRLDLEVAARVERLDQPTLIDELAGSPLARLAGPQAAFFTQAAEFLSERIVFVDVTGTAQRPQFRLKPGKQLKEEAIRYFLRGSQILPNAIGRNN